MILGVALTHAHFNFTINHASISMMSRFILSFKENLFFACERMNSAKNKISYEFEEKPEWRSADKSTSAMIDDITAWRNENLKNNSQPFVITSCMAVDYIQNLNFEEMVGTQTHEDTEEVLKKFIETDSEVQSTQSTEKIETLNTYKAMAKFYKLHEAMERTGILTVDIINDLHKVLLKGLHPNCGTIRDTVAYTHWNEGPHFYPPPQKVEGLLYALVDHHNICMDACPSDTFSGEYTAYIFKCAARLLFEFVDTHPFGDGNGRMCRLLANHIVGLITPFPVALYHKKEELSERKDYINAIVRCREHPEEGPGVLAAMLVEGAWHGWQKLLSELKEQDRLVPIVVEKSLCTEEYISERISHVWDYIVKQDVVLTKEEIVKKARSAALNADLLSLSSTHYLLIKVPLGNAVQLPMKVFA